MQEIEKYDLIDVLKFIAAIMVVTIHVAPFSADSPLSIWNDILNLYIARLAVPFFFCASGFFLYKKINLKEFKFSFVKKYIIKMLTLYLIWTAIYFPFSLLHIVTSNSGFLHGVALYIRNSIFWGSYTHLWYLNATIFAVILISLLLKFCSPKVIFGISVIFFILGLLSESWFGLIVSFKNEFPIIWLILKFVEKIVVTSQDGLFQGFVFISLGLLFANNKIKIDKNVSLIGFLCSFILLGIEVYFVHAQGIARGCSMYFFVLPTIIFLFSLSLNVQLDKHKECCLLRKLSIIIYFLHCFVLECVDLVSALFSINLRGTSIRFILTITITMLLALLIVKATNDKKLIVFRRLFFG